MSAEPVRRSLLPRGLRGALPAALAVLLLALASLAWAEELFGNYTGPIQGQRVAFARGGTPRNAWAGTLGFHLDSGEDLVVFCIQLDVGVGSGNRYRTSGPVEDLPSGCQLYYILDRYPGATAGTAEEAAARQMAIWHFSDGVDLTTITNTQSALRDRAIEIAAQAEAGPCPERRVDPPDLRVSPAMASAHAGERVVYTIAAGALDAGRTVSVTVAGSAVLDNGGQSISTELDAAGAAAVGVTSTGVGTATVHVQLPYQVQAGIVLSQIDDSRPTQRLVMAQHLERMAEAMAAAAWDEAPTPTAPAPTTTAAPATYVAAGSSPTAAPSVTAGLPTLTPGVTPSAAATVKRPTGAPGATQTTSQPQIPSALPRTGGGQPAPWPALGVTCILLGFGLKAFRRRICAAGRSRGG